MENKIFKAPVMYLISTKHEMIDSEDCYINTIPVMMNTCNYPDSEDINGDTMHITPKEHILGVIPAPVGMSQVYTFDDETENMIVLGFEYPNHENPNWEELVKEINKQKKKRKSKS
jgi:hypothetical protein